MTGNIADYPLEQTLIRTIRGYEGYRSFERRGRSDQRLREYLSVCVGEIVVKLEAIAQRTDRLTEINKLIHLFNRVAASLHRPSYHDSSFFTRVSPDVVRLEQLYESEVRIYDYVRYLRDDVKAFSDYEDEYELSEFIHHMYDAVDSLNHILVEREFILIGTTESVV